MINKPSFWLAFKALSQIRTQIMTQLVERLCAFNAYYHIFNDKSLVMNSVLNAKAFTPAEAEAIYSDTVYGMDTA